MLPAGDETAVPAIGAILDSLGDGCDVDAVRRHLADIADLVVAHGCMSREQVTERLPPLAQDGRNDGFATPAVAFAP